MHADRRWIRLLLIGSLLFSAVSYALGFGVQQTKPTTAETKPAETKPAETKPADLQMPEAHFHHLHLNTVDSNAAIDFYTSKFDCEKAKFAGLMDAVWAQKSWLLFTKVNKPPVWELNSAIWHFGWGAEDMKAAYEKQQAMGTKFFTPITDISDIGGNTGATGRFYYAYVQSPDNALIELNTASHHRFGHLHLFSADPLAAGDWYAKYLGAKRRTNTRPSGEPRFYRGHQIGPSVSLVSDNVNIIIYPVEYAKKAYGDHWKGRTEIESTKGHVVDHIGFSFDNLSDALEKMRKDGVKVIDEIRSVANGKIKFAFVEGPDKIRIELIEGHARKE
jgi:catechol 2,3-dioxygenase-like lactoylglutathione lyase family enzyme/predicted enzyme related to lactoylglutathione lyase